MAPTASRPDGFTKQALCKVAYAGALARLHLGIIRALRAVPLPVAYGQPQRVCPRPPVRLAASQLRQRAGLPIRPPRGLPQSARGAVGRMFAPEKPPRPRWR